MPTLMHNVTVEIDHEVTKEKYRVKVEKGTGYNIVEIGVWYDPKTRRLRRVEIDGKALTEYQTIALWKVLERVMKGEAKVGE